MSITGPPRQTSPAYLRELATTYERSSKPAARGAAQRLREIAGELDELLAMSQGAPPPPPPTRLVEGTDIALQRLRRAQQAPAPTAAELAELRAHQLVMMIPCPTCGAPSGYSCSNDDRLANHCPERTAAHPLAGAFQALRGAKP